jgi:hypothetical protein
VPILTVDALGIRIGMDRQNLGMSFGPWRYIRRWRSTRFCSFAISRWMLEAYKRFGPIFR